MKLPSHIRKVFLLVPRRVYVFEGRNWEPDLKWCWLKFVYLHR